MAIFDHKGENIQTHSKAISTKNSPKIKIESILKIPWLILSLKWNTNKIMTLLGPMIALDRLTIFNHKADKIPNLTQSLSLEINNY